MTRESVRTRRTVIPARGRRVATAAAIATAAAGTVASVGTSTGSERGGDEVVRYRTVVAEAAELDHGDPGASVGDQLAFSDELRRRGERIGHNGVLCTLTSLALGEYACTGLAKLRGRGTIAARFFLRPGGASNRVRIAITGGTGEFRSASGQGVAVILSETRAAVTLNVR